MSAVAARIPRELNACRAWMWLETGEWGSKLDAAAWLRERVRARIAEEVM